MSPRTVLLYWDLSRHSSAWSPVPRHSTCPVSASTAWAGMGRGHRLSVGATGQGRFKRERHKRRVSGSFYEFDVVQIQPGDPNGEGPYVTQYRLDAKAGEERIFIARLHSGQYLIRGFHKEGLTRLGGELNLVFASVAGEIRYIGRVLVEIPQRVSRGKGYRFTVENARDPTLAQVSKQHADLTKEAVNVPMQVRGDAVP